MHYKAAQAAQISKAYAKRCTEGKGEEEAKEDSKEVVFKDPPAAIAGRRILNYLCRYNKNVISGSGNEGFQPLTSPSLNLVLLVPKGFDGIEVGRAASGVIAEDDSDAG